MRFEKGKSGNLQGRPRKKVESPEAFRNEIHLFLVSQLTTVKKDWKSLKPRDRVAFFERLSRYILPSPDFDLNKLSEQDLDRLIERIKQKLNGQKEENTEN